MYLFLTRSYLTAGTNGKLECDGLLICYTIELPWNGNKPQVSCIPEGRYCLRKRYSARFKWHLEVQDVVGRKFVLFHPANTALKELKGCIAPVTEHVGEGKGVLSRRAFYKLTALVFKALTLEDDVILIVQS